jgi:hypothetical protein
MRDADFSVVQQLARDVDGKLTGTLGSLKQKGS